MLNILFSVLNSIFLIFFFLILPILMVVVGLKLVNYDNKYKEVYAKIIDFEEFENGQKKAKTVSFTYNNVEKVIENFNKYYIGDYDVILLYVNEDNINDYKTDLNSVNLTNDMSDSENIFDVNKINKRLAGIVLLILGSSLGAPTYFFIFMDILINLFTFFFTV